jgi:hypothetical protein
VPTFTMSRVKLALVAELQPVVLFTAPLATSRRPAASLRFHTMNHSSFCFCLKIRTTMNLCSLVSKKVPGWI